MTKFNFRTIGPYLACILIFAAVAVAYFTPELFEGKVLFQADTQQGIAIGHEAKLFQQETGEQTRWTNSLFGGMPTYQSSPSYGSRDVMRTVERVYSLFLPAPASYLFIMMLGFFILLVAIGVRKELAVAGALMYAFSSYFFIIIEAGHLWKFITLAYIPPTIGGILLTYRGRYLTGGALTAFFAALQINSNHVQMTYYFLFVILALAIGIFVDKLRNRQLPEFFKASAILIFAAILAVGVNVSNLYHTWQYSKETMRGGSELAAASDKSVQEHKTSGLEKEYITQWSYGIGESFSLMIPDTKGGATGSLSADKNAMKNANPMFREYMAQMNRYWGDQPFTSGPVYVGAFVVFLFILGLFIVKGWIKWALLAATLFSLLLSWGKNLMPLTEFFIDHMPMYNKFRAVSSMLVIAEFCMPLLAVLTLKEVIAHPSVITKRRTDFAASLILTAGLCLLFALLPDTFFSFLSGMERDSYLPQAVQQPQLMDLLDNLQDIRRSIFTADAWRSFFIISAGAAILFLYSKGRIKTVLMIAFVGILTLGDMWSVDKRYLNASNFVPKRQLTKPFEMTEADKEILKDKDPNYRVLNLTTNTFNDATTSYFHKSVGGYHAAKLQRYQDLIDHYMSKEIDPNVIDMLNTKYIIVPGENNQPVAQLNPNALGNAWFVDRIEWVNNASQEIQLLGSTDPATTALIDKRFEKELAGKSMAADSSASISLTSYAPNMLVYRSDNTQGGLAVFSEIYYPGWTATIDGVPAEIVRADYVLRALYIPAGNHEIAFSFHPKSIRITDTISYISMILILLLGVAAFVCYRKQQKNTVA